MRKWKQILQMLLLYYLVPDLYAVVWSVLTHPMIFGSDVTLMCEANYSSCNSCVKRFYKGETYQLLSIGQVSSNNTKYKAVLDSGNLFLIIHNFTKDDINIKYICAFGVDSYAKYLTIPYIPWSPDKTISIDKDNFLDVEMYFKEVFVELQCKFFLNYNDITSDAHVTTTKDVSLYNVSISLRHHMKNSHCICALHIQCSDGYHTKYIFRENIHNTCSNVVYWTKEETIVFVIVFIYLALLISVVCYDSYKRLALFLKHDIFKIISSTFLMTNADVTEDEEVELEGLPIHTPK